MTPLWQILVCSVWARTSELSRLLDHLAPQLAAHEGQVEVLIDRDNCKEPVGVKRTRLVQAATAEYVCFVDDDDWVADDYAARVMLALEERPDYVGFTLAYSEDGVARKTAVHSLRYPEWAEDEWFYYRGVSHLNPIRRDAAVIALPFLDGFGEDHDWGARVQASGMLKQEVFLAGAPLYSYRWSRHGSLFTGGTQRAGVDPGLKVPAHVLVLSDHERDGC